MRLVVVLLLAHIVSGCATDEAAKIREERPVTVGLLGVAYRPHKDWNLEVNAGFQDSISAYGPANVGFKDAIDRNVKTRGNHVEFGVHRFLRDTSAFIIGLSARRSAGVVEFDADRLSDSSKKERVEYSHSATYIGVPVGWFWIWPNGFTLGLDAGPRFRVGYDRSYNDPGDSDVNADQRDEFRDKMEKYGYISFGGNGIIGYSF